MMYSGGNISGVGSEGNGNSGGGVGNSNCCSESTDPVLDLLSDLYSELNIFLCKG